MENCYPKAAGTKGKITKDINAAGRGRAGQGLARQGYHFLKTITMIEIRRILILNNRPKGNRKLAVIYCKKTVTTEQQVIELRRATTEYFSKLFVDFEVSIIRRQKP